jgi:hypothetical protein
MANELAEPSAAPPAQQSQDNDFPDPSTDDISRTISSAMSESDRKYLGEEEKPEKKKAAPTEKTKKPEIGDSEIPLDDEEPEKAVEEGEEEDDEQAPLEAKTESDRAKSDAKWKMYRQAYRENPGLKSENQTLKAQLAKTGDQSELNTLREHVQALASERQRLIGLVEQGNIEHSEIWDQQIMGPLNQMWEDIQVIGKRNGMDPNDLAKLLQAGDDKALNNYMEEHEAGPGDRHYLFGMIRDVQRIERHKAYLRNNAHQLTQQSRQQMLAQRDQYFRGIGEKRTNAIQTIAPKIEQKILSILPKDKRRNLQNDMKYILDFENWDTDVQMYAGCAAVVMPDLLDSYNLLRGQLKEAKQELIKFRGGAPSVRVGGKTSARPPVEDDGDEKPADLAKMSLTDFAEQSAKRARQAFGYRK